MSVRRETDRQLGIATSELRLDELERRARAANGERPLPLREWIDLAEAWRIAQALRETGGNRSAAARMLGIGRRTLYSKLDKLGLEPTWCVSRVRHGSTCASEGSSESTAYPDLRASGE